MTESHEPDPGGGGAPDRDLLEKTELARAQKGLLQLLARVITQRWLDAQHTTAGGQSRSGAPERLRKDVLE